MKASELIFKLKELKEAYGDKEVKTAVFVSGDELVYEDVYTTDVIHQDGVVFFNLV